jgi:hypothetical protein
VGEQPPERPVLRLVRGTATPEELAAVVTVLASRSGGGAPAEPAASEPSLWGAPQLRGPHQPGPGAWKASSLPR